MSTLIAKASQDGVFLEEDRAEIERLSSLAFGAWVLSCAFFVREIQMELNVSRRRILLTRCATTKVRRLLLEAIRSLDTVAMGLVSEKIDHS